MKALDETIKDTLNQRLSAIEAHLEADAIFYYGEIHLGVVRPFRDFIEKLAASSARHDRLVFLENTPGGSVEAVEKMVEISRHHYAEIYFVVPDAAMSAGTILCMSGDKIYMDYSSSLGPIDPQVNNGEQWVPALGYLDKVKQLLERAEKGTLTNAEFMILQSLDLALLSRYEQARDLTVTLLKKWLVEYKFKDWKEHKTTPSKIGKPVTDAEKNERAEDIARKLGDNRLWHSHGRMIGCKTLSDVLNLKIDDYSGDEVLRPLIREYNDLLTEYIARNDLRHFMHSRLYF